MLASMLNCNVIAEYEQNYIIKPCECGTSFLAQRSPQLIANAAANSIH